MRITLILCVALILQGSPPGGVGSTKGSEMRSRPGAVQAAERPAPSRPAPKPQTRPQPSPAARPQPKPAPRPQPRPAPKPQARPAVRPQSSPAPAPTPQPTPAPTPAPAPSSNGAPSEYDRRLLDLTNQVRVGSGLNPLIWNDRLGAAAMGHTQNMLAQHDADGLPALDHMLNGESPTDRARAAGYAGSVGENLYFMWMSRDDGFRIYPDGAIEAWLGSPGHRANMLDPRWREMGAGIVVDQNPIRGGRTGTYTQLFGDGAGR